MSAPADPIRFGAPRAYLDADGLLDVPDHAELVIEMQIEGRLAGHLYLVKGAWNSTSHLDDVVDSDAGMTQTTDAGMLMHEATQAAQRMMAEE